MCESKQKTIVFVTQMSCVRSIGAGIEAFFLIPIPNRYRRYRPIPSTRCRYRSHPSQHCCTHAYSFKPIPYQKNSACSCVFMSFYFDNVTKSSLHMHTVCTFQNVMTLCFETYVWYVQRM